MPRPASIPYALIRPILQRWADGHTTLEILRWIAQTNGKRRTPVVTSRGSIDRLLARAREKDPRLLPALAKVRIRGEVYDPVDCLEDIGRAYWETYWDLVRRNDRPADRRARFKALASLERQVFRRLDLGLTPLSLDEQQADLGTESVRELPRFDAPFAGKTRPNESVTSALAETNRTPPAVLDAPGIGRYGPAVLKEPDGLPRPRRFAVDRELDPFAGRPVRLSRSLDDQARHHRSVDVRRPRGASATGFAPVAGNVGAAR